LKNEIVSCIATLQVTNKSTEEKAFTKTGISCTTREGIEEDAKREGVKHTW
jgi:hypothetical protein